MPRLGRITPVRAATVTGRRTRTRRHTHGANRRVLRHGIAVIITCAAVAMSAGACTTSHNTRPLIATATADPAVSHDALLDLAGALVGGRRSLADPSTGQLPSLDAFHTAGIATLTISGSTIRVVFRTDATPTQEQAALDRLHHSPLIAAVTTTH